jgi:hypothetical protein
VDSRLVWERRLAEVEDDMETRLLRAQQAELPFTLQVPQRGTVCGVLYYFPYQDGAESAPLENPLTSCKPASSPVQQFGAARATQQGPTQAPRGTQAAPRGTQAPGGGVAGASGGLEEEEEEEGAGAWQVAPIFEAFWQGRLIPGARIDTLPFIESVRSKRSAQAKASDSRLPCSWQRQLCVGSSKCSVSPSRPHTRRPTSSLSPFCSHSHHTHKCTHTHTSPAGCDPRRGLPPPAGGALLWPRLPRHPQQGEGLAWPLQPRCALAWQRPL